jgi:hypothetical protein
MRDKLANYESLKKSLDFNMKSIEEDLEKIKILKNPVQDEKPFYSGKREDVLRRYTTGMTIDYYYMVTRKYTIGEDLQEVNEMYKNSIKYLKELSKMEEGIASLISAERYIDLFALSILFEAPKENLEFLVDHASKYEINELAFDYMVNGCGLKRRYYSKGHSEKYYKFATEIIEIAQQDKQKASESFVKYMSKKWFKDYSGSWGKDAHLKNFYTGYWAYVPAAIAKILDLDDKELEEDNHYPYELRHYKNEMRFTPEKMLDIPEEKEEYKIGIPEYPKLEQVVAPPFQEKINQYLIDFKKLDDKELYEKYEFNEIWPEEYGEYDDYVKAKNEHGFIGFALMKILIDVGQVLEMDARELIDNILFDNYWGDIPVKFVSFDMEDDSKYYSYIPQSTTLDSIFDMKIEDIHIGLLDQGGLEE